MELLALLVLAAGVLWASKRPRTPRTLAEADALAQAALSASHPPTHRLRIYSSPPEN